VIFGADDPRLNPGVAKQFHRHFTGSRLHLLAGAGHCMQLGAAEQASGLTQAGVGTR